MSLLGNLLGRAPGRLGAVAVLALSVLLFVQAATSPSARAACRSRATRSRSSSVTS